MNALLSMKVVPVMNGNDVVAPPPQVSMDLKNVSWQMPNRHVIGARLSKSHTS